jgi:hypothetical protein
MADLAAGKEILRILDATDLLIGTGTHYFVDSNLGSSGNTGRASNEALATIAQAIAKVTASKGDTIFVMPGHAETVAAATEIAPAKAGVNIIGLGVGAIRPTLTFTATGSNIPITGASVVFSNFLIVTSGTINVTAGITVTGTDVVLEDIEIRESAGDSQIIDGIVAAATSDRLHVNGLIFRGHASGDADASAVSVTGAVDGVLIENFDVDGLFVAAGIENVTGVATNIRIRDGFARNRHATTDACVTLVATTTGTVERVNARTATNDADGFNLSFVGDVAQFYDCLCVNDDGQKGGSPLTASAA